MVRTDTLDLDTPTRSSTGRNLCNLTGERALPKLSSDFREPRRRVFPYLRKSGTSRRRRFEATIAQSDVTSYPFDETPGVGPHDSTKMVNVDELP